MKRRARLVEVEQPNDMRDLLAEWDRLHKRAHGIPYVFTRGKDARLLQPGLNLFGFQVMADLMGDFFRSTDPFVRQAGDTVPVFVSQLNKLAQQRRQTAATPDDVDWWQECQARHGGRCNGRAGHIVQCRLDELRQV